MKLGAVAGFYGEALRSVDAKISRRNGMIKSLTFSGKLGRDTPLTGDLRGRSQGREVIYLETNDAGAFSASPTLFEDGWRPLSLAMDPPVAEPGPREGLINVRDFSVKGEASLDRLAGGVPAAAQPGIAFSRLRAEFTRQNGQLTIREGVVKGPTMGATIEGSIDYAGNQVRMSGTFIPMYGVNNVFGQIPLFGHSSAAAAMKGCSASLTKSWARRASRCFASIRFRRYFQASPGRSWNSTPVSRQPDRVPAELIEMRHHQSRSAGTIRNGIIPRITATSANASSQL